VSVESVLPQIPGSMPGLSELPDGCRFHPRCSEARPQCSSLAPRFAAGVACHLYDETEIPEASNGG